MSAPIIGSKKRRRLFVIQDGALAALLAQGHAYTVDVGLPPGTKVLSTAHEGGFLAMVLESDAWDLVDAAEPNHLPRFTATLAELTPIVIQSPGIDPDTGKGRETPAFVRVPDGAKVKPEAVRPPTAAEVAMLRARPPSCPTCGRPRD